MKLTKKTLRRLVEEVLNEQPPAPPKGDDSGGEDKPKPIKMDIPDSPFEPDVSQIKDGLKQILKQWHTKEYPWDEIRWKEYYNDIAQLYKKIAGDE